MNLRPYMQRIEDALGRIHAADRIEEGPWFEVVMRELDAISRDCAKEMQKEAGGTWNKGAYQLDLHESPPTRLLALGIALSAWLGWVMHEKHPGPSRTLSAEDSLRMVREAFEYGVILSKAGERP